MTVKLLFYIIAILQEYLLILKHQPRISNLSHFQVFLERRFWLHSSFCLLINYYTKLISNPLEHKVQTGHLTYKFHRQKYCKFAQSSEIARFEWGQTYYIKLKLNFFYLLKCLSNIFILNIYVFRLCTLKTSVKTGW